MQKVDELVRLSQHTSASYSPFIEELLHYLETHVSDSNLTLKWIAENHLYMNVNYVSRCFVNETHQKFSTYLMNLRVQKAKEILSDQNPDKIQNVAELVGCGNNPYYFSKIFKKCTGMTPFCLYQKSTKRKDALICVLSIPPWNLFLRFNGSGTNPFCQAAVVGNHKKSQPTLLYFL